MTTRLKEVTLSNFKSFRKQKISLQDFNIVVGRNASGKTNFLEFFKFIKTALLEERRPFMPFIEWWSYQNIVWAGNEELPIESELKFEIDGVDVTYSCSFSGMGGTFRILSERLVVDKNVSIEREGQILRIKHDEEFIKKNESSISKALLDLNRMVRLISKRYREEKRRITIKDLMEQECGLPKDFRNLLSLGSPFFTTAPFKGLVFSIMFADIPSESLYFVGSKPSGKPRNFPFFALAVDELKTAIENITFLRHPNMKEVKTPSPPKKEVILSEDASNLHNILYNNFLIKKASSLTE